MAYICKLTKYNKIMFKKMITSLYDMFKYDNHFELAAIILVWIVEYFRAWLFIDTDITITDKVIEKKLYNISWNNIVGLCEQLYELRNELVHSPYIFPNGAKYNINFIKLCNRPEIIKQFCSVFEEDSAKFEVIYTDVMKTLGLLQVQEQEDTTSSLQNDNPLSLDTHYY